VDWFDIKTDARVIENRHFGYDTDDP